MVLVFLIQESFFDLVRKSYPSNFSNLIIVLLL